MWGLLRIASGILKRMWTYAGARSTGEDWTRRKRLVVRHNHVVLQDAGLIDRRRSREAVSNKPDLILYRMVQPSSLTKHLRCSKVLFRSFKTLQCRCLDQRAGDTRIALRQSASKRVPRTWYIGGRGDRYVATSSVSATDMLVSQIKQPTVRHSMQRRA